MLSLSFRNPAEGAALVQQTVAQPQQSLEDVPDTDSAAEQVRRGIEVLLSPEAQKAAKSGAKTPTSTPAICLTGSRSSSN